MWGKGRVRREMKEQMGWLMSGTYMSQGSFRGAGWVSHIFFIL